MMCTFLASCTKRGLGTCLVLHKRLKGNDIQVSICMHLPWFEECNITYKFFHMQLFARVRSLLYMDRYRRQFEFAKPCPFLWDYPFKAYSTVCIFINIRVRKNINVYCIHIYIYTHHNILSFALHEELCHHNHVQPNTHSATPCFGSRKRCAP